MPISSRFLAGDRVSVFVGILAVSIFLSGDTVATFGQDATERPIIPGLIEGLLALDAPPPDWRAQAEERIRRLEAEGGGTPGGAPGDDAPLTDLIAFWGGLDHIASGGVVVLRESGPRGLRPVLTDAVRARLLDACIEAPELLDRLLHLLPEGHETHARLLEMLGDPAKLLDARARWRSSSAKWLLLNCREMTGKLAEVAAGAKDADYEIDRREYIVAIAERSWPHAKPVLERLVNGDQPRTASFAAGLIYLHAVSTGDPEAVLRWRKRLVEVVEDTGADGRARRHSLLALMRSRWSGRDEWFLGLFADRSIHEARAGNSYWPTILVPVREDPAHWVPLITGLIGNENSAVHDGAVLCLSVFHDPENARTDALRPLLPWLEDRAWARGSRWSLLSGLREVDLRDAIPGLIRVVEASEDPIERSIAAEALRRYRDPRAAPALRHALDREYYEPDRLGFLASLVACGGLSDEEAARSIVAQARHDPDGSTSRDARSFDASEESLFFIGRNLVSPEYASDGVATHLVEIIGEMGAEDEKLVRAVRETLAAWPVAAAVEYTLDMLEAGEITPKFVRALLAQAVRMREAAPSRLQRICSRGGLAGGIAAVVASDAEKLQSILEGEDLAARAGLLLAARLVRVELPVALVAESYACGDPGLEAAAEAYLIANDGPDARELVWRRHPGEALILGGLGGYSGRFKEREAALREFVLAENGPDELFGIMSSGTFGVASSIFVIVRAGEAQLSVDRATRRMSETELNDLRDWLATNRIEDLAPLRIRAFDGVQYTYIRLTRDGGRRVYMNNPGLSHPGDLIYQRLVTRFREL